MRAFTAAAIQVAPVPAAADRRRPSSPTSTNASSSSSSASRRPAPSSSCCPRRPPPASRRAARSSELWDLVSTMPGPVTEPIQEVAARLGVHVVFGTYERGDDTRRASTTPPRSSARPGTCSAATARRTCSAPSCGPRAAGSPRASTRWWWSTELGRIGLIICFDGDYPELSRITAVRGAEVICRPSALLRSADIWELTNRARAYDNHVFVVGANATGIDPAGVLYFGNSMIVTPTAEVVARAASHEGWVSARLDPRPGAGRAQPGIIGAAALRPPGRPQPGPDPALRRRPGPAGGRRLPARRAEPGMTVRIGIDTGGTFTDVVALDERHRRAGEHEDPVHPVRPGRRLPGRGAQGARPARAGRRRGQRGRRTAPPSPPTGCSKARSPASGS